MNTFQLRHEIIENGYKTFVKSFGRISNTVIQEAIEDALKHESDISNNLPEPLVQFNPFYAKGKSVSELVAEGMAPELEKLFPDFVFHKHQTDATSLGQAGKGFIVTSGTGSGKSLTYLLSILDYCIKERKRGNKGVKAILVYPMNPLLNSQQLEIDKYLVNYLKNEYHNAVKEKHPELLLEAAEYESFTKSNPQYKKPNAQNIAREIDVLLPVVHYAYSGQDQEDRDKAKEADIILTNYMMLELIMTRSGNEKELREGYESSLKYLVFDELHTYRGRQGADVALLIICSKH